MTGAEIVDERGEVCVISVNLNEAVHIWCLLQQLLHPRRSAAQQRRRDDDDVAAAGQTDYFFGHELPGETLA